MLFFLFNLYMNDTHGYISVKISLVPCFTCFDSICLWGFVVAYEAYISE